MSSRLCGKAGLLHLKDAFTRSTTVSIAVKNMGGKFSNSIGRVSGINTKSSSYTSDEKKSPKLGLSVGRKPMREKRHKRLTLGCARVPVLGWL